MKHIIFSALTSILVASSTSAYASVSDYEAIHTASIHGDVLKMETLCQKLAPQNDDTTDLYLAAYCEYRLAYAGMGRLNDPAVKAKASAALTRSSKQLQRLLKSDGDKKADGLALLTLVYGAQIHLDPSKAAELGRKAWGTAKEAESIAPSNPHVQFAKAGNLLFTPPAYGGDLAAAAKALELAKLAYPAQPTADNWGLDDVHMYSAIVHMEAKQYALAKTEFEQVLAISPEHGWALHQLKQLP